MFSCTRMASASEHNTMVQRAAYRRTEESERRNHCIGHTWLSLPQRSQAQGHFLRTCFLGSSGRVCQ